MALKDQPRAWLGKALRAAFQAAHLLGLKVEEMAQEAETALNQVKEEIDAQVERGSDPEPDGA